MSSFEITYEFPDIQGPDSELRIFLKSNSSFSLGGFTLRPSFFNPELDNQKIEVNSISGTNNFITSINTNNGIISGFSNSGEQSNSRENKEGQWLEIARYQFNKQFTDSIQVQTDINDGDFFQSNGTDINIQSHTKTIDVNYFGPELVDQKYIFPNGTEDITYLINSVDLLKGFEDIDGDNLSVENLSANNGTITYNGNDIWSFSPNSNLSGKIDLIYEVTDGHASINASNTFFISPTNDGAAEFSIDGTAEFGETLSISKDTEDADGTGTLSYSWQTSSDDSTWSEVGTDSSYTIAADDEGKSIKAVISYQDDQGFDETVTTTSSSIPYVDDGDAIFLISGTAEFGETLTITKNREDPDGTGTLSYSWQTSSDGSTWSEVGTDSSYTIAADDEGKSIKAVISYQDDQGFSETVTTDSSSIPITNDGAAEFSIDGTAEFGETLSISKDTEDADGTGTLSYSWQTSSDDSTWDEVGTDSSYTIAADDEGKSIKAVISYQDDQGFSETVTTDSSSIPITNDGAAEFSIDGTAEFERHWKY